MMKNIMKVFWTLALLLMSWNLAAQRIAMIDIKGTDEEFVERFSKAGLSLVSKKDNKIIMQGVLKGEMVMMNVDCTPISHFVYRVTVTHKTEFSSPKSKQQWKEAKMAYESRRGVLVSRYGEIYKEERYFEKPYREGKGKELRALSLGKGKWQADWGEMQYFQNLRLTMRLNGDGHVLVEYWVKDAHLKFLEEDKLTQNQL